MADRVGQRLGNYHLIRLLGQGSFAEVYLGKSRSQEGPRTHVLPLLIRKCTHVGHCAHGTPIVSPHHI